jgi:monovalent cation/hydrogen antiporter
VQEFELVLVLLGAVTVIATLARVAGVPYPILMVVGGLVLSLIPGVPRVELEPEIVLVTFLPPILFAAAFFTSVREFWRSIRPISLLAVGLVIATTLAVATVAVALVPAMGWPLALALGAIVSPTDPIAATSIAQRLGLPRRIVTVLEGEGLVNDSTALVVYGLAVTAITTAAGFSVVGIAAEFAWVVAGGVVVGVVAGLLAMLVLRKLLDPPVEVLISLLVPYAAYLPAEALGVSGVLATVVAGLIVGWWAPRVMASDARILGSGAWQMVIFIVNGLAFLLVGLQLPEVVEVATERPIPELLGLATAVCLTVIAVRLAWVFPGTYLPRLLVPGLARRDPAPPVGAVVVLGWAGMRGAVSLAAALALPITVAGAPLPERDLVLFLTFAVILVTLLGQGLTLPRLIRTVGIGDDGSAVHEEVHARQAANAAALARLDGLVSEWPTHRELIDQLRLRYEHADEHLTHDHDADALGREPDQEAIEHRAIRQAVIDAQRFAVLDLRDRGIVHDEAMRRVERDLDLEELQAEA